MFSSLRKLRDSVTSIARDVILEGSAVTLSALSERDDESTEIAASTASAASAATSSRAASAAGSVVAEAAAAVHAADAPVARASAASFSADARVTADESPRVAMLDTPHAHAGDRPVDLDDLRTSAAHAHHSGSRSSSIGSSSNAAAAAAAAAAAQTASALAEATAQSLAAERAALARDARRMAESEFESWAAGVLRAAGETHAEGGGDWRARIELAVRRTAEQRDAAAASARDCDRLRTELRAAQRELAEQKAILDETLQSAADGEEERESLRAEAQALRRRAADAEAAARAASAPVFTALSAAPLAERADAGVQTSADAVDNAGAADVSARAAEHVLELSATVAALEQSNRAQSAQLAALEAALQTSKDEARRAGKALDEERHMCQRLVDETDKLQRERIDLLSSRDSLQSALTILRGQLESAVGESARAAEARAAPIVESLSAQAEQLRNEVADLTQRLEASRAEGALLLQRLEASAGECAEARASLDAALKRCNAQDSELLRLRASTADMQSESDRWRAREARLKKQVADVEAKHASAMDAVQAELSTLRSRSVGAAQVPELQRQLVAQAAELDSLRQSEGVLRGLVSELQTENTGLSESQRALSERLRVAEGATSALAEDLTNARSAAEAARASLESEARAHKETSARELVLREESKRLRVALEAAMKKLQRHISDDDSNSVDRRIVIQLLVTYLTSDAARQPEVLRLMEDILQMSAAERERIAAHVGGQSGWLWKRWWPGAAAAAGTSAGGAASHDLSLTERWVEFLLRNAATDGDAPLSASAAATPSPPLASTAGGRLASVAAASQPPQLVAAPVTAHAASASETPRAPQSTSSLSGLPLPPQHEPR